jgi:hypothetical protein
MDPFVFRSILNGVLMSPAFTRLPTVASATIVCDAFVPPLRFPPTVDCGRGPLATAGTGKSIRIFARFSDARTSEGVTPFAFLHTNRISPESSLTSSASMLRLTLPSMKWTFHNSSRSRPCICSLESR